MIDRDLPRAAQAAIAREFRAEATSFTPVQMTMPPIRFPVAVIFERTPLENRWVSEQWQPVEILPAAHTGTPGAPSLIADAPQCTRWRFDGHALLLHRSEAEGYFLNITTPDSKVFVMWRRLEDDQIPPVRPEVVTVSYNEAARLMDGGEQVDALPMPADVRAWLAPFVAEHYKPEPRRKVKRNDPFADDAYRRDRDRTR